MKQPLILCFLPECLIFLCPRYTGDHEPKKGCQEHLTLAEQQASGKHTRLSQLGLARIHAALGCHVCALLAIDCGQLGRNLSCHAVAKMPGELQASAIYCQCMYMHN